MPVNADRLTAFHLQPVGKDLLSLRTDQMSPIRALAVLGCLAMVLVQPIPAAGEESLAPMLARVIPGVVSISTEGGVSDEGQLIPSDPSIAPSVGSGSIIDAARGLILTDYHVIQGAEKITVALSDGRSFEARVLGTDDESDIAVIKIDASGLTELPIGDSAGLHVGDYVVAVGNPFGLGHTVTHGIVSALGRTGAKTDTFEGYIQTDAAINPGNSGGPLLDLDGRIVGINSAIIDAAGGSIGLGFAVPSAAVRQILPELIAHGEIRRGQLGVVVQDLTADLATALHVDASKGAVVSQVLPGSAAEIAGLAAGDVIIAIDGHVVSNAAELRRLIGNLAPQTKVYVTALREGRQIDHDADVTSRARKPATYDGKGLLRSVRLGRITRDSPAYGKTNGALVIAVDPDSDAANSGLSEGDIIATIDRKPVGGPEQAVVLAGSSREYLLLGVHRDDQMRFVVIHRRSS
jgi:serine protease Do/serine protease DegQ